MGSLPGHLLPGTFFICFAIWWTTQLWKRKCLCNLKQVSFYSTATWPCLYGKLLDIPVEGTVKIVATVVGMAGEIFAAFDYGSSSRVVSIGDIQHVTMYAFFCLSGVCDVLQAKWSGMPPGGDYMAAALAFSVEALLFSFHLHGRAMLDTQIHLLLVGTVLATVILVLLEYNLPHSLLVCAARVYCVFLQGTWFIQVGLMLYHPVYGSWKQDEHHVMVAAIVFVWHGLAVFLAMLVIGLASHMARRTYCPVSQRSDEYRMLGHHSYRFQLSEDSDSESSMEELDIQDTNVDSYVTPDDSHVMAYGTESTESGANRANGVI